MAESSTDPEKASPGGRVGQVLAVVLGGASGHRLRTALTMAGLIEALGLALPGAATVSALGDEHLHVIEQTGRLIVALADGAPGALRFLTQREFLRPLSPERLPARVGTCDRACAPMAPPAWCWAG